MSRNYKIPDINIISRAHRQRMSAFTLIELMIVITIISILTSISVIGATSIQRSTRDDARQSQSTIVAEALEKYYEKNNEYPSVASITPPKTISDVKQKLAIKDDKVLTFPTVTAGTSVLVASNPTPARLTYVANTVDAGVNGQCQTDPSGYCDAFALQYVKEADSNTVTINSRHNAVYAITDPGGPVVLSPPTQPAVVGSQISSSLVRFTASSASCSIGSVEYKIRYNTSSSSTSSMPDWSTVTWSAATTKDINPGSNTRFYSQSLARCVSGTESSADSTPSAVDTLDFTPAPPAGTPPSAPGVSASGISTSQISVSWSPSSGSATISYTVRYGTTSGTYGSTATGCSGITTTSCTIGGLAANTYYYIQVTATNTYGSAAGTASVATQAVGATCSSAPSTPSPSASGTSSSSIQASWSASSTPANCSAPTYTIQYGTSSGSYGSTACSGTSATSCTASGLSASTTYYIQVTATNSYGSSYGTTSAATQAVPPPTCSAAPSATNATAGGTSRTSIKVDWSASINPANCTNLTYTVTYGTISGSYGSTGCQDTPGLTCTISGLTLNTTYYVFVTPKNNYTSGTGGSAQAKTLTWTLTIGSIAITETGNLKTIFNYDGPYQVTASIPADTGSDNGGGNYTFNAQLANCTVGRTNTLTDGYGATATASASGRSVPSAAPSWISFPNVYANGFQVTWQQVTDASFYSLKVYWPGGALEREVAGIQSPQTVSSLAKGSWTVRITPSNCAGAGAYNEASKTIP